MENSDYIVDVASLLASGDFEAYLVAKNNKYEMHDPKFSEMIQKWNRMEEGTGTWYLDIRRI
jgi:hypothetical protein